MFKRFSSLARMWAVSTLILVLMAGSAFAAKGPTLKEKIAALGTAGKTIPVVYWPCFYNAIEEAANIGDAYGSSGLSKEGVISPDFAVIGQTALDSLNKGFGVTAFSLLGVDKVAMKTSFTIGKEPDWTSLDNDIVVSVGSFTKYTLVHYRDGILKKVNLMVWAEIKIIENTVDKNGKKKSSVLKTIGTGYISSPPTKVEGGPVKAQADLEKVVPQNSLVEPLKAAVDKKIAEFTAKP